MASDLRLSILVEAVDKASDKLRGIGGNIKQEAKGMGASLFQAGEQGDMARQKLQSLGSTATQVGSQMAIAGGVIVGALGMATEAAMVQEEAENRLRVIYKDGADELIKYAAALQKQTRFGDEVTISTMALGATFPALRGNMEEATRAAMNMSEAYGMDLQQSMLLLGKAAGGQVGALSRYGIMIDTTRAKAEGLPYILEVIAKETRNAAFEVDNASKAYDQFKNAMGDVAEEVGNAFLPVITAAGPVLTTMAEWMGKIAASPLGKALAWTTAIIGVFLLSAGSTLVILGQLASAVVSVATAVSMFGGAAGVGGATAAISGMTGAAGAATAGVGTLGATMLASLGPIAAVVAALAVMAWSLKRTADMYEEASDAAREAQASFEAAQAAEDRAVAKGYADTDIRERQKAEIRNAKITWSDRVSGAITGGGMTARDFAQQRVAAGQASAVHETRMRQQRGADVQPQRQTVERSREVVQRESTVTREMQPGGGSGGQARDLTIVNKIGDEIIDQKVYRVTDRIARSATATAGAY